ncbi:hypothetical protein ACA910_016834 [Epithemia clementina (nom. ined.)]
MNSTHYQRTGILRQKMAKKQLQQKPAEEKQGASKEQVGVIAEVSLEDIHNLNSTDFGTNGDNDDYNPHGEHSLNVGFHPILQTVTFSDDGCDEDGDLGSYYASHHSEFKTLRLPSSSFESSSSTWAMMGQQYADSRTLDGVASKAKNEKADFSNEALVALMNMSIASSTNDQSSASTPRKRTLRTPKRFYHEWRKEGLTATPGSLLQEEIAASDDEISNNSKENVENDEQNDESIIMDASTPPGLSPSPVPPASVSPFSTFKHNSSHIALDETKVYLRRIKELQEEVQSAHDQARQEALKRQETEAKYHRLQAHLLQEKSSPHATTAAHAKQRESPQTPVSDSLLWERNKTLVKEVRFADQTCVELSAQNVALEKQVDLLQQQSQSMQAEMEKLQSQIAEKTKLHTSVEARLQMTETRSEKLEAELSMANKSLLQRENELSNQAEQQTAMKAQLDQAEKHVAALESDLLTTRESLSQSQKRVLELESDLSDTRDTLAQSERLHEALSSEIKLQYTKQEHASSKSVEDLSRALKRSEELSKKLVEVEQQYNSETSRLQQIIKEAESDANAARFLATSLERSKGQAETELQQVREELKQMQDLQSKLSRILEEAQREIEHLQSENENLRTLGADKEASKQSEYRQLVSKLGQRDEALAKAKTELEQLQDRLQQSEANRESTEQQKFALASELDYFMSQKEASEKEYDIIARELREELENATKQLKETSQKLEKVRDELAEERTCAHASRLEIEKRFISELDSVKQNAAEKLHSMSLQIRDEESEEKTKLENQWKEQVERLKQQLQQNVDQLNDTRMSQTKLEDRNSNLEQYVSALKQHKDKLMEDLELVKSNHAAEIESLKDVLEENESRLKETEERLRSSKAQLRTIMVRVAGSVEDAAAEIDGDGSLVEEKVNFLRSRLWTLVGKLDELYQTRDNESTSSSVGIASEVTEQFGLHRSTPCKHCTRRHAGLAVKHSIPSVLVGDFVISQSADGGEIGTPTMPTLSNPSRLNMTRDLERMEEARHSSSPGENSPTASTIAGLSHVLDSTFLSVSNTSPTKTPTKNCHDGDSTVRSRDEDDPLHDLNESTQEEEEELESVFPSDRDGSQYAEAGSMQDPKLVEELKAARGRCVNLEAERGLLIAEKGHLQQRVGILEEKYEQTESIYANSLKELEACKAKYSTLSVEHARLAKIISEIPKILACGHDETEIDGVRRLAEERKLFCKQLSEYERILEEKTNEIRNLKGKLDLERNRFTDLSTDYDMLGREVQNQQDGFSSQQEEIRQLKTKLATTESERDQLSVEAQENIEDSARKRAKCDELLAEVETLRQIVVSENTKCKKLEKSLELQKSERDDLKCTIQEQSRAIKSLEISYDDAIRELEDASKAIKYSKAREAALQNQTENDKIELEQKNILMKDLQDTCADKDEKLSQADSDIANLQLSLSESVKAMTRLKESFLQCNDKLIEAKEIQNAYANDIVSAKALADSHDARARKAESQLDEEIRNRIGAEKQNQMMSEDITKMKNELKEMKELVMVKSNQLLEATTSKEAAAKQIQALSEQLEQSQHESVSKTKMLQNEMNQLKDTVDSLIIEKATLEEKVGDLVEEKEEKDRALAEHAQELEKVKVKCQRLKEYARKLVEKCDQWEEFFQKQSNVVTGLQEAREQSRHKASELARQCRDKDKLYKQQLALWSVERNELYSAHQELSNELDLLARELPSVGLQPDNT